MRIEELWRALEEESPRTTSAWLIRLARPQPGPGLLVALERATGSRALLLPINQVALPPRRDWPECRGLEVFGIQVEGSPHLGVRLRDRGCADVFTVLAEDVASRVVGIRDPTEALAVFLGHLRRWQQFLAEKRDGLSVESQRGLWGELHVLATHLLKVLPATAAVTGWKAPSAAHQDFQFAMTAMEVKSTAAKQPQNILITSERQLDDTGVGELFLHVVILDEREVAADTEAPGMSLPGLVASIRKTLLSEPVASVTFEDRLADAGWLDAHSPQYEGRRWTVRGERSFAVRTGFPRIVEDDLHAGVGDVNYHLSLAACEPFALSTERVIASLTAGPLDAQAKDRKPHR